jgi:hypothetical protein
MSSLHNRIFRSISYTDTIKKKKVIKLLIIQKLIPDIKDLARKYTFSTSLFGQASAIQGSEMMYLSVSQVSHNTVRGKVKI